MHEPAANLLLSTKLQPLLATLNHIRLQNFALSFR